MSARETVSSLYGAYRLARGDAGGLAFFETGLKGFWNSFYAAVLIAPFYAVFMILSFQAGPVTVSPIRIAAFESIAYVITWVAFPLAMFHLCRSIGREKEYLGFITAYNWAAVIQNGLFLPLAMLSVTKVIPTDAAAFLNLAALSLIVVYSWFIAKEALRISPFNALGVVAFDFAIGVLIDIMTGGAL